MTQRADEVRKKACPSDSSYVRSERPGNWRQSRSLAPYLRHLRSGSADFSRGRLRHAGDHS